MRNKKIKIGKKEIQRIKFNTSKVKIGIDEFEITPMVKSLIGVVKLPKNYDYKKRLC